jgi:hypothetical protein
MALPNPWLEKAVNQHLFPLFFGDRLRHKLDKYFLIAGIIGFMVHLSLIALNQLHLLPQSLFAGKLFHSPIAALYTPFSFILVYEAYLLVYYLHKSFTTSIGKQFEIVSLLLIRGIFKDISGFDTTQHLLNYPKNLHLIADVAGFALLFLFIFGFYYFRKQSPVIIAPNQTTDRFVFYKKAISILLIPALILAGCLSVFVWYSKFIDDPSHAWEELSVINQVFYHDFFTILILADVLILLISFRYTEHYSFLIRNSGFIISTILIRISFSCEGLLKIGIILSSVLFGIIILMIHNMLISNENLSAPLPKK